MFRFGDQLWLWGLLLAPLLVGLFVATARARRRALAQFGDHELVRRLSETVSPPARRWKAALAVTAAALLILALARPQFGTRVETVQSRGQDIVIAVDLSQSMLAEDVAPNRLERARLSIFSLMEQLDGDRIGLVAFAADAFVQSPLTTDYGAAGMFLNAMHPELMPIQGTDIGRALEVSLDALESGGRDARVLVLVTDGEDHEETFEEQLSRVEQLGVELFVVGIGTSEGVPIPVFDAQGNRTGFLRDEDGSVVTTRLGEESLRLLVGRTGTYVQAGSGGSGLDDLVGRLVGGDGESIEERQVTQFEEQYQWFLGLALLLLLIESGLSERRRAPQAWAGRVGVG